MTTPSPWVDSYRDLTSPLPEPPRRLPRRQRVARRTDGRTENR